MTTNISNQTFSKSPTVCLSVLYITDPYIIALNVIRILISLLYFVWFIFLFTVKEFRVRQMSFLHNLYIIGVLYCITGLSYLFYTNCTVLNEFICYVQAFNSMFMTILSGYGLAALAMYRLSCILFPSLCKNLNFIWLFFSIGSVWILSISFSFIEIFAFGKPFYYIPTYNMCLANTSDDIRPFIFFVVTLIGIPNLTIMVAYVMAVHQTKLRKGRANIQNKESLRITVQLVIYIILFELSCIASIIMFYQQFMMQNIVSEGVVALLRCLKWFHHLSPLGLLYFHPVLLNKYRKMFKFNNT